MKVAFYTLGCKVNQYETQLMRESLLKAGFQVVPFEEMAQVYIINSCTVTAVSNQKTRQCVRACKRKHPDCITVLAGCMSQAYPALAEELPEADIIIGNTEHKHLPELIERFCAKNARIFEIDNHENGEEFESGTIHSFDGKTRAEVKIEDGCNRFCTYCAIPYARGRVRSKPAATVMEEVQTLASKGFREIVLVGINLSAYKDGETDLGDVVQALAPIAGLERIRLGSLEPDHLTDALLTKLAATEKFCPQFHISLQSGCDKTLKAMNRHYCASEYKALAEKLRQMFPDCTLTTDVMVGFPGENEEDFAQSLRFVEEIGFEKLHVFPYSVRKGTVAAEMEGQLPKAVKAQRAKEMIALGDKLRSAYFESLVGKSTEVLFESKKAWHYIGHTKNFVPVKVKTDEDLQDSLKTVTIISSDGAFCYAEINPS